MKAKYKIGDRVQVKDYGSGYIYDIWEEGKYVIDVQDDCAEEGYSTKEIEEKNILGLAKSI